MISTIIKLPASRPVTEVDLCGWVGQAMPGDALEYHRGFLALDTVPVGTQAAKRDRAELIRVARRAWWAAERGLVHLVQRRHGDGDYSYIAVARPKPQRASASLSSLLLAEVA